MLIAIYQPLSSERCGFLKAAARNKLLLGKIHEVVGTELAAVEDLLREVIVSQVPAMQKIIDHLSASQGKRLRPALVLLCGSLSPSEHAKKNVLQVAVAAELIHTASLVHDDIIDGALWRRDQPSVHACYGNKAAVLAGDFLFARAFGLLPPGGQAQLFRAFSQVVGIMCEGEMEQAQNVYNLDRSRQEYLQNVYRKTAALLETCCGAGARLSGLEEDAAACLEEYGRSLGMAFQLIDDLLDIVGDPASLGKPVQSDIIEGNITLPYIYLLEDPCQGQRFRDLMAQQDYSFIPMELFGECCGKNDPLKKTFLAAEEYVKQARHSLVGVWSKSSTVEAHVLHTLDYLADYVLSAAPVSVR